MTAFVRNAESCRIMSVFGAASVTKSAAPAAGTDWPNVPTRLGGGVDVWLRTLRFCRARRDEDRAEAAGNAEDRAEDVRRTW